MRIETKAVHSGERNEKRQHRSVTIPTEQTAAYYFKNTKQIIDFYNGKLPGIKYGRYGNPTQHAVEKKIAVLENCEMSLLFPSGMSALTTAVLALVKQGEHILFTNDHYRNIGKFFKEILPKFGILHTEIPMDDMLHVNRYIQDNTVLFFSETPTNPFLRIIDLAKAAKALKQRGIIIMIDSTFATPINLRPINYGADIVVHSATKYLGGHHDLFAGVVAGKSDYIDKIQQYRDVLGGIIDPHTSYLLLRSLQTLPIRMKTHNENALLIAEYLEKHPKVERVYYPGLKSHPDYKIAKKQMSGFGGVITFLIKASEENTGKFVDSLKIPYIATNFGGPQSLIEQHSILTFYRDKLTASKRGIAGNLIRFSVGFEHPQDIIADFKNAFNVLK